ncbi:hypothetical protein H5410_046566 [Solanum commersonii]|uniref:Uncharacterized protein n=1 Tax=Solanum commersonii TaxID=4109 RepID=A0A9J5XFV9_SOLCO|nr:hypothetical protein H5410_046566 [Solanum commersonii]
MDIIRRARVDLVYLSIHKDQDQMNAHSLSVKRRYTYNLLVTNDQARQKLFSLDFYGKKEDRIPDYADLNRIICTGILIEIPINGIFYRNSILAYFDDPQYRRKSLGIIKYGTIEMH